MLFELRHHAKRTGENTKFSSFLGMGKELWRKPVKRKSYRYLETVTPLFNLKINTSL